MVFRGFVSLFALAALQAASAADDTGPEAPGAQQTDRNQSRMESDRPALDDSEWKVFRSLAGIPANQPQADGPPQLDMEHRRELARQIEDAQRKLTKSGQRYAGTSHGETLEVARQLLDITRARLLGDKSIDNDLTGALISDAMNRIQLRIDVLRAAAARSADPEGMNARLDELQGRLALMRQRLNESESPEPSFSSGVERVERLYDIAQEKLDEAYERASGMPDAEHLIERLDAAQRRLNEARSGFEARAAPEVN